MCFFYVKNTNLVTDEVRKGLPIILTDLINATKTHCISFTDIMPKEKVNIKKNIHTF
jgi:hypothetical protein